MDPNIANPAARAMAALTLNTRLRNSLSGSTGSAACLADSHQAPTSTTDPANSPMITGEPHG